MNSRQEARYALDYGLDRDGLSPDAQTEYDRLMALPSDDYNRMSGVPIGSLKKPDDPAPDKTIQRRILLQVFNAWDAVQPPRWPVGIAPAKPRPGGHAEVTMTGTRGRTMSGSWGPGLKQNQALVLITWPGG
jgi:hypothetical protein